MGNHWTNHQNWLWANHFGLFWHVLLCLTMSLANTTCTLPWKFCHSFPPPLTILRTFYSFLWMLPSEPLIMLSTLQCSHIVISSCVYYVHSYSGLLPLISLAFPTIFSCILINDNKIFLILNILNCTLLLLWNSRPDLLDAALLRPGRLDRLLFCGFPSWHERLAILKVLTQKVRNIIIMQIFGVLAIFLKTLLTPGWSTICFILRDNMEHKHANVLTDASFE